MADEFLMKGKVFADHCHKLAYPVYAEVKYDEIRLHVRLAKEPCGNFVDNDVVQFLSYAGNPLANLEHWAPAFLAYMRRTNATDLDLGVLVNGNFNDSYRWVRSTKGIPKEKLDKKTGKIAPALDISMVQFYLFDIPHSQLPFDERRLLLTVAATTMNVYAGIPTKRPEGWWLHSEAELNAKFIERRELGDEGLMVKSLDHTYQIGKRIDGWLKMKPESSYDGEITKINQAVSIEGVPLDRAGSVDVLLEDGSTASPAGIPHELGRLMWRHPYAYMGQWVEFKCMERDRQGGYRHPSLTRLREAKA